MKVGVVALTRGGELLADKLISLDNSLILLKKESRQKVAQLLAENWQKFDGFICIMAAGIAVRSIAPLIKDKAEDPCVIVIDEQGTNVISLLSGHLGGGNKLTLKTAELIGANPVITTSSDTLNLVALDLWAKANKLVAPKRAELTELSARLVNEKELFFYSEVVIDSLPRGLKSVNSPDKADFVVTHRLCVDIPQPIFRPLNLVVGTGCNRGTPALEFEEALEELFQSIQLSPQSIRNIASIDKKNDEKGLLEFAASRNLHIDFFTNSELNRMSNLEISFAALKAVGAIGVAEPACLLSAKSNQLISRKQKWKNITMAVAQVPFTLSARVQDP